MGNPLLKKKKAVGLTNQGQPDSVCPKCQQPIQDGQMVNYPQGRETHVQCPPAQPQQQPGQQATLNPPPSKPQIPQIPPNVGKPVASVVHAKGKLAGVPRHPFPFVVPFKAASVVAFHLAKAGLEDYNVIDYADDDAAEFTFHNEPELKIAEEIVRQEFAEQIASRKGRWDLWMPRKKDPTTLLEDEPEPRHLMSSEKTAEEDGPQCCCVLGHKAFTSSRHPKTAVVPPPPPTPHAHVQKAPAVRKPAPPPGVPDVAYPPDTQNIYLPHVEHPERVQEEIDKRQLRKEQQERRERLTGVASKN